VISAAIEASRCSNRSAPVGLGDRLRERVADQLLIAVEGGELIEDGLFQLLAWEAFAIAGFRPVFLAASAGVVVVAAAVAVGGHADVGLAAAAAAQEAREEEVGGVAAPPGVLAALGEDGLRLREGELVHQGLVHAVEDLIAPADLADVGGVADDPVHRRSPQPAEGAGAPSSRSCCAMVRVPSRPRA